MKDFFKLVYNGLTSKITLGEFELPFNTFEIVLKFILPITITLILYKLLKRWTKKTIDKSKIDEDKKDVVFNRFRFAYRIVVLTFIFFLIVGLFGTQINRYIVSFGSVLTHPIIEGISIVTILLILPVLYLAQVLGRVALKFAQKTLQSYSKIDLGTKQTLAAVAKNATFVIVVLFGLTIIGIDLTILFGLFGVVGIGLGFGLQGVVGNLFAGLIILTSKPVKVGDHIIIDGTEGNLQEIRFLNSVVSTVTHESIIIPNSKIIDNPVHNFSFDDPSILIKNTVQVSYNSDLELVMEALVSVGEKCPYRLKSKKPTPRVISFDDSGITVGIICWISNSSSKYDASSWINMEIWRIFKERNIEIPFPQIDLHIKKN
ncbi:MAG: mechanosensitive ion channel [Spirochaetales bacterium]|nr:mechanosensitive ion channel [Spirochaetales bacterium]